MLDTQKWLRDNSSTVSSLLARLATNRNHNPQVRAELANVITAAYFRITDFILDKPSDPSTAPIGFTRVILEKSVP